MFSPDMLAGSKKLVAAKKLAVKAPVASAKAGKALKAQALAAKVVKSGAACGAI